MNIEYKINIPITVEQFISVLKESSLADRRPIDDMKCIKGMVENSNLIITAWDDKNLIGLARSVTDFNYACYLSDLAVNKKYQKNGIGKKLQEITQEQLGEKCKLILISAPNASSYYEHIGFTNNKRCWVLERDQKIS